MMDLLLRLIICIILHFDLINIQMSHQVVHSCAVQWVV